MTSFDRPRETCTDAEAMRRQRKEEAAQVGLTALAANLKTHEFLTEMTPEGLVVRNPHQTDLADTVTCKPNTRDGMRLWFFTSWQEPLAEADRVTDAVVQIKGYLTARM